MKPTSTLFLFTVITIGILSGSDTVNAQQYKMRQVNNMAGMKSETTIYVKGPRKRTEGGGFAGINAPTTIEQCDLQRTIKISDKKKLYYIEPFTKEDEITEDETKSRPATAVSKSPGEKTVTKKGGVIYMYYNINDTGERKKIYGLTARHVWTTQKIKPSADACMMKDSMIIKTDGWYIDLSQFNCPVSSYSKPAGTSGWQNQECQDRFISKRSGKGKLGFPLQETRTMIMNNGMAKTSEFETSLETLEFSSTKLDSMLFEIPLGYKEAKSEEELQDKSDMSQPTQQYNDNRKATNEETPVLTEEKKTGATRIGVYESKGNDVLQVSLLQKNLVNSLTAGNIEAVAISSEDDAKKYNCDMLLAVEFTKVKQGNKVGSFIKAIKNTDPSAATSYTIEANLSLFNLSDGSTRSQQKVNGKYDGKADEAAMKALEQGCNELVKELR
jgi:hypothetical protein